MVVQWQCNGSAMAVQWQCNGSAMAVQWQCNGSAMAVLLIYGTHTNTMNYMHSCVLEHCICPV